MEKNEYSEQSDTTPLFLYGDITPETDGADFSEQQTPVGSSLAEFHAPVEDAIPPQRVFHATDATKSILKFSAPYLDTPSQARPEAQPTTQPFEDNVE